jgi:hypothetical protein
MHEEKQINKYIYTHTSFLLFVYHNGKLFIKMYMINLLNNHGISF